MQVLEEMNRHLNIESLKKTDEAWLVIDIDDWKEDDIQKLLKWAKKSDNYGVALSNPNFEFWLLLHFEDGKKLKNHKECSSRLRDHLPNYNKDIDAKKITLAHIRKAIARAKQRDANASTLIPELWGTTVYKLVNKICEYA